ncbi:ABC transporter permease [Solemya velum gill symbiont]|uniref:ABC transporter permease n=1 Tax=Solemya velum gill symbiont TaxID=2340 RepID=UPI000996F07A|nr:ABC transporter permease [Solemya velum gill symbiont]OOY51811.1 peptide ABC transporter permease [Solemya velum gill symbiont]OOY55923.1 peptide ABC transporter permease [Solemya velum gill symbiont]OOY57246.1 peptide ABC transporter permease [Solemya velum gill symbiont]OOY60106.1 peptide ABC transporter permease [Solemya velum gill symbiont]OOY61697.1 peptide ABC transporter permease [Solemya velum gill symbiont]
MATLYLAIKSLLNRRFTVGLTLLSIALSVSLLLGVERLRVESHNSFANTISGTDLIVGARSGAINLLLYSVFRIGDATNNISWKSYQKFADHPMVKWTIPISLGDSHKGYRVMGTNQDYFRHYSYADKRPLALAEGLPFEHVYQAVLGHEVAKKLNYTLGQKIIIAHGAGKTSFTMHDDKPFEIVGILKPTGTPVDRTVHIPLEGIEAIHANWVGGREVAGLKISADEALEKELTPKSITGFLVGLKSIIATFRVQREVNDYRKEPLLAILPGVALQQLWDLMSVAENALFVVTILVVSIGLIGMLTVMLAGLNERRREMAILRSVGARPGHILLLITGESFLLSLIGITLGLLLLYTSLFFAQPIMESQYGLHLQISLPSLREYLILGLVGTSGLIIGLIPGYRAYRYSLTDGMNIRL